MINNGGEDPIMKSIFMLAMFLIFTGSAEARIFLSADKAFEKCTEGPLCAGTFLGITYWQCPCASSMALSNSDKADVLRTAINENKISQERLYQLLSEKNSAQDVRSIPFKKNR